LQEKKVTILDKGCYSEERADYPDYGHAVANSVLTKELRIRHCNLRKAETELT